MSQFAVVWGNGRTAVPAGVVSTHASREEAMSACEAQRRAEDNSAVGYWVAPECPTCGQFGGGMCADCR